MNSERRKNTLSLTKAYIDRATHEGSPKSKDIRWDTQIRNFGVRIYPSGQKTFVLFYRINGRQRLMKLGVYGIKTLDEARKDARQKLATVDRGTDPLAQRQDSSASVTVGALCLDYIERYAKPHKKSWFEDQRLINRYILPYWKGLKINQIRRPDMASLHHKIGKTSYYEANRVKSLLSKMWECAREWGLTPDDFANPARGITGFPEAKRTRYVTQAELPKLAASIDQEPNLYIRTLFWLYLLTGVRKSELLRAEWTHLIQSTDGTWSLRISETKSGEPVNQPLSIEAFSILSSLPRVQGNPYIFVGHLHGRHLVGVHKNWHRIRERADVKDVRIHDLRHTVGSWLAQSGYGLYITGKVLNHSDQSTTQRYAHLEEKQARRALEHHSTEIMRVARGQTQTQASITRDET